MIQPATLPRTWPYMVMAPCHSDEDADLKPAAPHEDFCQWLARQSQPAPQEAA